MKNLTVFSHSVEETIGFAEALAKFLKKGDVLGFFGDLGSGKTTFIKGIAKGLGLKVKINSPSFVILKIYKKGKLSFYHFDLYRLKSLRELEDIGYEDFICDCGVCVIEWADKAMPLLPKQYLKIEMKFKDENTRIIHLKGYGMRYSNLIAQLKGSIKAKNTD